MLGYVTGGAPGESDRLLAQVAQRLHGLHWPLCGVIQINSGAGARCDMDLEVLGAAQLVRISQSLGPGAQVHYVAQAAR